MKSVELEKQFAQLLLSNNLASAEEVLKRIQGDGSFEKPRLENLKGLFKRSAGRADEAENHFLEAIQTDPRFVPALTNLAGLYISQGRYKSALPVARAAFKETKPATLAVAMPLITALLDSAQIEEALQVINALPQAKQLHRDPQLAFAACYRQSGDYASAKAIVNRLYTQYPNDPTVIRIKADLEGETGDSDPLPLYDQALQAAMVAGKSNLSALKWNMSLHLLRARKFKRGWEYYEEGLSGAVGTLGRSLPTQIKQFPKVDFDKIDRSKWTIAVVEQGIGDQILFLSAMEEIITDLGKVALICEERLKPILRRSFPKLELLSAGVIELLPYMQLPINGCVPIGTLFGHYRQSLDSFAFSKRPFLRVNKKKYEHYRTELQSKARGRPIVGLSWKGGFWENQQRNKAVDLSAWQPVLKQQVLPVCLQYGDVSKDLNWAANEGFEIVHYDNLNFKNDIDDWLALSAACDGIISVSTALVHFAGACNQKVAVIMPDTKGPWILGLDDKRSIVYPNVHYFRRGKEESIQSLLHRVSEIIN